MCSEEIGRHPNHRQLPKTEQGHRDPTNCDPRVDEVLDTLGGGSVFSVFDLFSGFTQLTIHPDTIPLTAFCTPNGLYEWLRMPQGAAGAPAWFVSVMRLVTAGLDNIRMYLDDAIARTTVHSITWQHSLPSLRDYAFINSSSLLINPGLVPHVLTFWVTSSPQMAYAPTTIASPPSHACPCLRISNSSQPTWRSQLLSQVPA